MYRDPIESRARRGWGIGATAVVVIAVVAAGLLAVNGLFTAGTPHAVIVAVLGAAFVLCSMQAWRLSPDLTRTYYGTDTRAQTVLLGALTAILLLILGWGPLPWLAPIGYAALWVVMLTAVVSAVDYYRRFIVLMNARVTDVNVERSRRAS